MSRIDKAFLAGMLLLFISTAVCLAEDAVTGSPVPDTGRDAAVEQPADPATPFLVNPVNGYETAVGKVELSWSSSDEDLLYHIQISTKQDFSDIIADEKSNATRRVFEKQEGGVYFWRVSAIGRDGIESDFSEIRSFKMKALPEPPSLGLPAVTKTSTTFRWKRKSDDDRYHLQISRDRAFTDTVFDLRNVEGPRITIGTLEEGIYFVRVSTVDMNGIEGRFSEPQEFHAGPDLPSANIAPLMIMIGVAAMLVGIF